MMSYFGTEVQGKIQLQRILSPVIFRFVSVAINLFPQIPDLSNYLNFLTV